MLRRIFSTAVRNRWATYLCPLGSDPAKPDPAKPRGVVQVPRRLARTVFFPGGEAAGDPGPVLRPTPVVASRPRLLSLIGGASIEANDAADRATAVSMHAPILKIGR